VQVHAGQRLRGTEPFGQTFGLDNCCHAAMLAGRADSAPSAR
jgi:hypothetical protein